MSWAYVTAIAMGVLIATKELDAANVPSYYLMNDRLFEGDIAGIDGAVIASSLTNRKKAQNGLTDQRSRWVNGVIPYYIAEGFNLKQQGIILHAMDDFSSQTCIKFQPLSNDPDSILFQATPSRDDCGNSQVGRKGGVQTVFLSVADDRDCVSKGIIQHELMHVVGFLHEQARSDRNDFVNINKNNLDPEVLQKNFLDWSAVEVNGVRLPLRLRLHHALPEGRLPQGRLLLDDPSEKEWAQYETGGQNQNQPLPPPPPPMRAPSQRTKVSISSLIEEPNDGGDDDQSTTAGLKNAQTRRIKTGSSQSILKPSDQGSDTSTDGGDDDNVGPPVRPSARTTRRTTRPSVPVTEAPPTDDDQDGEDPGTQAPTQRTSRPRRIAQRPPAAATDNGGDTSNVWPSYLQPGPRRTCEDAVISGQDCRTCTTSTGNGASTWKQQCLTREPDFEERSWHPRDPAKHR
ncbi:putative Zinc metalloproteinase nas-14 [Hypsibius exemplaris]|uniref:Metalloendopeptidase n=1 Tax=Hypsibius exemplaris TaxID=2072580 RepID=A0A1W0WNF5_HYPEX|nr:putative Zinc metalloproteinase nas-14 [Hypsibius exemplaris]